MASPKSYRRLAETMRGLLLYGGIRESAVVSHMLSLLEMLGSSASHPLPSYAAWFHSLAEEIELGHIYRPGNPWQQHLLGRLLADENPLSHKANAGGSAALGASTLAAFRHDLDILHDVCSISLETLARDVGERLPVPDDMLPLPGADALSDDARDIMEALLASDDWPALAPRLLAYYARHGTGQFTVARAFRWVLDRERGHLEPILSPDPVHLDDLIGYDSERRLVLQNTEQFLVGYPANNVLLYGDRGTGKSSMVKALLHAYGDRGLRIIEVSKQGLSTFAELLRLLRDRPERFLLFIDDLSFEEHETHYKELKAVLEGSLEARPENVLLYATSNRRHLIMERFSDRSAPVDDEIRSQDTMQEKLSLSDRFGITVTFLEPTQDQYVDIVRALAVRRGLTLDAEELRRRALQWATWHNGRSGRSARQFIDHLTGELGLRATGDRPLSRRL